MRISRIEIAGYRNLRSIDLIIPREGSFVVGMNGQGKTNFLESIYYMGTMRSFRSSKDAELIRFGDGHFRVVGHYTGDRGGGRIEVAYDRKKKRIKLNGVVVERVSEVFGVLKAVLMTPDDVEMIQSHPSRRRRFMDIVISMTSRKYLDDLTMYHAALRQRNTLLKDQKATRSDIAVWDIQMSRLAAAILAKRASFVGEISTFYGESGRDLAGEEESTLSFVTSPRTAIEATGDAGENSAEKVYEEAYEASYRRDRELGVTTVGPHRDDLTISLGGRSMRAYGSQGQQRTSVFALRLAEAKYIENKTGERPILLMDDVFSQLDRLRGGRLMDIVYGTYQTLVSTPRNIDTQHVRPGMGIFRVEGGEMSPEPAK